MTKLPSMSLKGLIVLTSLVLVCTSPLRGQSDSVTVVAGPQFETSAGMESWVGGAYRDLWTTPIRIPILDLDSYAGGLTPVERGGGLQTMSLRFRAPDGREYNFRSIDKDQTGGLHPDFRNTLIDRIAQDQVSSKHPAGALITSPLLVAAGVLHPEPRLFVMPDDPRLGEFREEFAGMLGAIELHADEGDDGEVLFADAAVVAGTDRVLEHIEESSRNRIDAREYLRARLMDFLVGDWDRHVAQWRWARYEREGVYWWVTIPEDRDNAFSSYDGVLLGIARRMAPHLGEFGPEYPDLFGLTRNGQTLDRRVLSALPRDAFDALASELQGRLSDEVIERAVANTPPEYVTLRGPELIRGLQARRAALPEIARLFYEQLAMEVEVRGTDESDQAIIERMADGSVEIRLHADTGRTATAAYYSRRFLPDETREVRVHLAGGDDHAIVRGDVAEGLLVRVIGGGGDDVLVDSSRVAAGSRTIFYDHQGENEFVTTAGTKIDTREFQLPERALSGFNENQPFLRDWGSEMSSFRPWAGWLYNVGPVIGGGPRMTRYGFRRVPHASQLSLRALYAPLETRFGLEIGADFRRTNSPGRLELRARATQLDVTRFHGFGNDTPNEGRDDRYKVWSNDLGGEVLFHNAVAQGAEVFAGPVIRYSDPELDADGPAARDRPFGTDPFGRVGLLAGAEIDLRDLPSFPRNGGYTRISASGFAPVWGAPEAFGALHALTAAYLPLPIPLESTLALRGGGTVALGDFPIQDAAFVGGPGSLRGYPLQRFAGSAAAFGGAELRTFLGRFHFISRGDLGLIALADAGRVFTDGDTGGGWHKGFGGGIWVGILDRTRTLSLVYARGEEDSLYFKMGMPF